MRYLLQFLIIPLSTQLKLTFGSITLRWVDISSTIILFLILSTILFTNKIKTDRNINIIFLIFFSSIISIFFPIFSYRIDIEEHYKNIILNSVRYIEVVILILYLFKFTSSKYYENIINYLSISVILNDILGIYYYVLNLLDTGNSTISFFTKGSFIYNFRYGFSVENSANASGTFLIAALPLLISRTNQKSKIINILYYTGILLHILLLILTGSKVSYIGLLITVIFYIKSNYRYTKLNGKLLYAIIIVMFCYSLTLVPESIIYRMTSMLDGDESTMERLTRFRVGLNILFSSPLTGYGNSNTFHILFEQYATGTERDFIRSDLSAHNSFMTFFVSVGLFGITTMLIYIATIIKKMKGCTSKYLNLSFLLILFGMLTDDVYNTTTIQVMFFLLASLIYYNHGIINEKNSLPLSRHTL